MTSGDQSDGGDLLCYLDKDLSVEIITHDQIRRELRENPELPVLDLAMVDQNRVPSVDDHTYRDLLQPVLVSCAKAFDAPVGVPSREGAVPMAIPLKPGAALPR